MNTNGIDAKRHATAVLGDDRALADHRDYPPHHDFLIVNDRAGLRPWHQRTVGAVRTIGKHFRCGAQARALASVQELRPGQPQQYE